MRDQERHLRNAGICARALHSELSTDERREIVSAVTRGDLEILLVSPEGLAGPMLAPVLQANPPARLVVDEAHCISTWGHDFRPDFSMVKAAAANWFKSPPILALTATATPQVRDDIVAELGMRDPLVRVTSFDRPNLWFEAQTVAPQNKLAELQELVAELRGQIIVYCGTVKNTELVAATLVRSGRSAAAYHARLETQLRTQRQTRFSSGETEILCATNAFGMGVDIPAIRAVIHYDMPGSLESYYQEAGRAGRDGLPSRCILFADRQATWLQGRFVSNANPSHRMVWDVFEELRQVQLAGSNSVREQEIVEAFDESSQREVVTAISFLHLRKLVRRRGKILALEDALHPGHLPSREWMETKKRRDENRLACMLNYANGAECRATEFRRHFGVGSGQPCGNCDQCVAAGVLAEP